MLSVYSVLSGYDYTNAVVLAVFATIGAIVLQAGVLGLQTRSRSLLLLCGIGSIFLLALLPAIMSVKPAAFGVAFGLGGILEGFYTIGRMFRAQSHCHARDLCFAGRPEQTADHDPSSAFFHLILAARLEPGGCPTVDVCRTPSTLPAVLCAGAVRLRGADRGAGR